MTRLHRQIPAPVNRHGPSRIVRGTAGTRWSPSARRASHPSFWILFLLLHVPLVMAMRSNVYLATAHAYATFAVGLACLMRFRTPDLLICVMGYIVASEPLWRTNRAMIFYEGAKYAVAGLSILALLKFSRSIRPDRTAFTYFLLLLPSLLVLPGFDREEISFNMSGPFALATCTFFLSSHRISSESFKKLLLTILGPILGFATKASISTATADYQIDFLRSKVAAGGLGNNQASSILGLGALLAFLYICMEKRHRHLRWLVIGAGLLCGVQGALTFSRGGVATGIGAIAVASFFLFRDRQFRGSVALRGAMIGMFAIFVAVPLLNAITYGSFERRFSSTHLTGRDKIIEADLIAFRDNPALGVGPGKSKDYHSLTFRRSSTHTEYSRLLAEHGMLGLTALLTLGWMVVRRLRQPSSPMARAVSIGLTTWSLLFMFHAAMRMAVVSFVFGLGALLLTTEEAGPVRIRRRVGKRTLRPRPALESSGRFRLREASPDAEDLHG